MSDLVVCTIQFDILWEEPQGNYNQIEKLLSELNESVDLIVLPEMFTTGFSMDAQRIAEQHDDDKMISLLWMRKIAKEYNAVITGSIAVKDQEKYYNRLYWVNPTGDYSFYDKKNLFAYAGEDESFTGGNKKLIEEIHGWNICPLICFDLRFPVWSKNELVNDLPVYDLLIYVANWPERRRLHWQKLLLARAIENQAYVLGVNRVGQDDNEIQYSGDSVVIDFMGEYMYTHPKHKAFIQMTRLSKVTLDKYRKAFPVLD